MAITVFNTIILICLLLWCRFFHISLSIYLKWFLALTMNTNNISFFFILKRNPHCYIENETKKKKYMNKTLADDPLLIPITKKKSYKRLRIPVSH